MTELERLRGACLDALEILSSRPESNPRVKGLADQLRTVVEKQYLAKSGRGLRAIAKEILKWAREIGGETARRVEESLEPVSPLPGSSRAEQIKSIISRRRIRNDNEYQALMNRVEEIYDNQAEQDTLRVVNELLADYVRRRQAQA